MEKPSAERLKYHEFQEKLMKVVPKGGRIYDVGKSDQHYYKEKFADYEYITLDKLESKKPDIVVDLERDDFGDKVFWLADAILFNGVTEQCNNPFKLLDNTDKLLKVGGHILFGIISVGYPLYEWDYVRFTPNGADKYVSRYKVLEKEYVFRRELPLQTYILILAEKI